MAEIRQAGGSEFPSTHWSRIIGTDGSGSGVPKADLEHLAMAYWKPIFAYIRARFARNDHDARDLTQDFFVWVQESKFLDRADPRRGRFRGYVKVSLANFRTDAERRRRAKKRGGGERVQSINAGPEDTSIDLPELKGKTPDEILDETWRSELLTRAAEELRNNLVEQGNETCFKVFQEYFLDPSEDVDYVKLAERHGISRTTVSNYLSKAKKAYRQILRREVKETVTTAEELDEELNWLFGEETE